jgi:Glycosyl hydrolase family 12
MSRRGVVAGALVCGAAAVALLIVPRLDRETDAAPATSPGQCTHPVLVTSRNRSWDDGGFVVEQDMWNNHGGTQTLRACSYHSWSVTANQPGTPDVNAYPNVHRDLDAPSLTSFSEISSRFVTAGPGGGSYDFAYDVWLNGVATRGSTEVMVWTDTRGAAPQVPRWGAFTSEGVRYTVYRGGRYIAFVGPNRATGEVDLLAFFRYAVAHGWLRADSSLDQLDYGVEIRSTGGRPLDFVVTDFALTLR